MTKRVSRRGDKTLCLKFNKTVKHVRRDGDCSKNCFTYPKRKKGQPSVCKHLRLKGSKWIQDKE